MKFKLGIVRDVLNAAGEPSFGSRALEVLKGNPELDWEYTAEAANQFTCAKSRKSKTARQSRLNTCSSGQAWQKPRTPKNNLPLR